MVVEWSTGQLVRIGHGIGEAVSIFSLLYIQRGTFCCILHNVLSMSHEAPQ